MPSLTSRAAFDARLTAALLAATSLGLLLSGPAMALAMADSPTVSVRGGRHAGFDRLVVDWPGAVEPRVQREGSTVRVVFPAKGRLDLARLGPQLGRHIVRVEAGEEPGGTVLVAHVLPDTDLRLFKLADHRVVVDVGAKQTSAAAATPARKEAVAGAPRAAVTTAAAVPTRVRPQPRPAAPSAGTDKPASQLQQELYRRDLMIASLLRRIERIERGVPLPEEPLPEEALSEGTLTEKALDGVRAGGAPAGSGVAAAAARPDAAGAQAQVGPGEAAGTDRAADRSRQTLLSPDRALERVLARDGTLLLAPGQVEVEPGFSFTRSEEDAPVFVTNGGPSFFIGEDGVERDEWTGSLSVRAGLPFDSQLELLLPYRYVDQSTVTEIGFGEVRDVHEKGHGFGDLAVAAAKTLVRQKGWRPDLVGRVSWDTRTGETSDDDVPLGGGFDEIGASLSALTRQDPLAFFATIGYETTLERDDIDPGDEVQLSIGTALAASPATSLRFSFDQRFIDEAEFDGERLGGSDRTIAELSLEVATILTRGVLLDVGVDVGLTDDAPDYTFRVSLPIRFDLPVL